MFSSASYTILPNRAIITPEAYNEDVDNFNGGFIRVDDDELPLEEFDELSVQEHEEEEILEEPQHEEISEESEEEEEIPEEPQDSPQEAGESYQKPNNLKTWIDSLGIFMETGDYGRDFSDGILVKQIATHYYPDLVKRHCQFDLPKVYSSERKKANWNAINHRIFGKLGFQITSKLICRICEKDSDAVRQLLWRLKNEFASENPRKWLQLHKNPKSKAERMREAAEEKKRQELFAEQDKFIAQAIYLCSHLYDKRKSRIEALKQEKERLLEDYEEIRSDPNTYK